jgi:tetratricopeptide (TPR) repeat protein
MNGRGGQQQNVLPDVKALMSRLVKSLAVLASVPVLLLGGLYGGRTAWHWWQDQKFAELTAQAEDYYEKQNLDEAARILKDVLEARPQDEQALRLWARILNNSPHNTEDAVALWRKLCARPSATAEDWVALGTALLDIGRFEEAQEIWDRLPPEEHQHRSGLELEAGLVRYTGGVKEADQILRRAYEADPENPDSRLKLAALDIPSPFPEISNAALHTVWDIARGGDEPVAVSAMETLSALPTLTAPQASELLARLDQMNDVSGAPRYAVLGGCLKALPHQRGQILDDEVARHRNRPSEESAEFFRWLLRIGESRRVMTALDEDTATHSRRLFPIYAEALNASGHWQKLQALLSPRQSPSIHPAAAAVMLAYCSRKLGEPDTTTLDHLKEALHHARNSSSLGELYITGTSAEELGFNDLALEAFAQLAAHRSFRLTALDHILQIRHSEGNLPEIIGNLQILLDGAPGLEPYLGQLCYHKILAGLEMEKMTAVAQHALDAGRQSSPTLHLALALSAFRAHDLHAAQQEAAAISPNDLPAGQRAVLAGILEACGKRGEAFQLAEKISPQLLLTEETRFLNGAL